MRLFIYLNVNLRDKQTSKLTYFFLYHGFCEKKTTDEELQIYRSHWILLHCWIVFKHNWEIIQNHKNDLLKDKMLNYSVILISFFKIHQLENRVKCQRFFMWRSPAIFYAFRLWDDIKFVDNIVKDQEHLDWGRQLPPSCVYSCFMVMICPLLFCKWVL